MHEGSTVGSGMESSKLLMEQIFSSLRLSIRVTLSLVSVVFKVALSVPIMRESVLQRTKCFLPIQPYGIMII